MKDVASHAAVAKPETAARTRQIVCNEIRLKWGKFSDQDLSALKDNNDLVAQRAAKYGLEKAQAQRDVDLLMKGRQI
jgi:hypothetical protein